MNVKQDIDMNEKPTDINKGGSDTTDVKPDAKQSVKQSVKIEESETNDVNSGNADVNTGEPKGKDASAAADDTDNTDNPFDVSMDASGQIDFDAMGQQMQAATKKFEEAKQKLRGENWTPPPDPTLEVRLSQLTDIAKDHTKGVKLAKMFGMTQMESLNNTSGMKSLKRLLMGPPADRKAAFDALISVQAMEWHGVSQACQTSILREFDGDVVNMDKLFSTKCKADLHVLKLVELAAKLATPPAVHESPE